MASAVSGFTFLVVSVAGLGVAAGLALGAIFDHTGWSVAIPGIAGSTLAGLTGLAGFALARDHTRVLLEREGMLAELEDEFHRLDEELRRVRASSARPETLERLERRVSDLERGSVRPPAPVRVEFSR